ncbi:MAG: acyl-CoA thioesterase [Myxococcota bacterium]
MAASEAPSFDLGRTLRVERVSAGEFTASLENAFGRAQLNDLLARAALAACETAGELPLVQLSATYLRPPPCSVALRLAVESLDDGAGQALRRVRVSGDALFAEVTASFARAGTGPDFGPPLPDGLPKPEDLPSTLEVARAECWEEYAAGPIGFRRVNRVWPPPPEERLSPHREWLRPRAPLPPDPRVHTAALAFASQFYSQWAFEWRTGPGFAHERFEILDHSLWVHGPVRWDDWWLLDAICDVSRGGRALAHRRIFARDGRLLASITHAGRISLR